jgi:hypothetical protein
MKMFIGISVADTEHSIDHCAIKSINSWIQVIVDNNLHVCVQFMILDAHKFDRIYPQDWAMALDQLTNLACVEKK